MHPAALLLALAPQSDRDLDRWRFHLEEQAFQRIWLDVSRAVEPGTVLFEHANLVTMTSPEVQRDRSLLVEDGRIAWIGPPDEARPPEGALRVDAAGLFLAPGLADMHTHNSTTCSQALLSLANGVTTERDMNGYPWLLARRERIRDGTLLAPTLHVAGHILNARPMGMYATVVTTPEEARAAVRAQVAAGYEFAKVHNVMPLDVYRAVFEEAAAQEVRVVGHVPQQVTLAEALERGHHTLEHFKGYILDSGLTLTEEDYVALTDGSGAWNCPTLSTCLVGLIGEEAFAFLDAFEPVRYVRTRELERWYAEAETRSPTNSDAVVWALSQRIFADLLETDARFLAGSDSGGGYPNQVPGFMLHEELRLMEELGLPTWEVLQAATTNAAEALETDAFGTLAVGKRADLVLVAVDPLETVAHLRRPLGVMVRGTWLPRATLDAFLERIEQACRGTAELVEPDADAVDAFLAEARALHAGGIVFMDHHLEELAELLKGWGHEDGARELLALRTER